MTTIPCLAWAKRGATVGRLTKIKLTEDEIADLVEQASGSDDDDSSVDDTDKQHSSASDSSDIEKKYGLDDYDDDDDDDKKGRRGLGLKNLVWHSSYDKDQYLVEDDEESEDVEIQPDDNILAIGRVKSGIYGLEAYVYNEASGSLFCHHDTILASFPLAMEWIGYDPGEDSSGNLLAVGTVEPDIELWDLDVINTLEPAFVLAGAPKNSDSGKTGHKDAVLTLSWNTLQQNVLASGSADFTVGLWDLEECEMVTSICCHNEKVQTLQWHPYERELLLSGSFDKTVCVSDCRNSDASSRSWSLAGEVEKVSWIARHPFYFLASTDNGYLCCYDVRSESAVFTVKAHKGAVDGLAVSSELPGCVLTSSSDQLIKVWDIRDNKPKKVCTVRLGIGEIHSMAACPDSGLVYAIGGESDLRIFHLKTSAKVLDRWNLDSDEGKFPKKGKSVFTDDESSESDESSDVNESDNCSFEGDSNESSHEDRKMFGKKNNQKNSNITGEISGLGRKKKKENVGEHSEKITKQSSDKRALSKTAKASDSEQCNSQKKKKKTSVCKKDLPKADNLSRIEPCRLKKKKKHSLPEVDSEDIEKTSETEQRELVKKKKKKSRKETVAERTEETSNTECDNLLSKKKSPSEEDLCKVDHLLHAREHHSKKKKKKAAS